MDFDIKIDMNKKQRILLIFAVGLVVIAGLFPPWKSVLPYGLERPGTYRAIWNAPVDEISEIDTARLGIEWILIGVVTGALWLILKKTS